MDFHGRALQDHQVSVRNDGAVHDMEKTFRGGLACAEATSFARADKTGRLEMLEPCWSRRTHTRLKPYAAPTVGNKGLHTVEVQQATLERQEAV